MTQSQNHLRDRVWVYAILWILCYTGSLLALKSFSLDPPVGIVLTLITVLSFALFIYKFYRSIVFMDEVQLRIQMEAVVVGFALGLVLLMTLGLLDLFVQLNREDWSYRFLVPYFVVFYFIGLFLSKRKYLSDEKHD